MLVAVAARHRDRVLPLRHRRLPPDDLVLALATPVFLEQGRLQPPGGGFSFHNLTIFLLIG